MLVLFFWLRIQVPEYKLDTSTLNTILYESILKTDLFKIVFVKSCENVGDIFTKNVNKDIYDTRVIKFLGRMYGDSDG